MQRRPARFVALALIALGRHRASDTCTPFCVADLARWVPDYPRPNSGKLAIDVLVKHQYVELLPDSTLRTTHLRPIQYWRLTEAGAQAAITAYQADRMANPTAYGGISLDQPVDPFAGRLWNLLRIRRALTADEAASVLSDAGEDIAPIRRHTGALLLAWSRRFPEHLQISAKRVDGFKRYVLQTDLGGTPPSIRVRKALNS